MPNKKNKKQPKPKKAAARKATPAKRTTKKKQVRKAAPKGRLVLRKPAKKAAPKKTVAKKKAAKKTRTAARGTAPTKRAAASKKRVSTESKIFDVDAIPSPDRLTRSAGQSGDLQGLSERAGADSEGVDELLEEGNSFEANVVAGVQHAGDDEEREVHTHEVLEDDVPEEYLDKDQ
jgi:hypothetical protein